MIRPTRKGLVVVGLGFIPAILVVLLDGRFWALWPLAAVLIGIAVAIDAALMPGRGQVDIDLTIPERLPLGQPSAVGLTIHAHSRFLFGRRVELMAELEPALGQATPITLDFDAEGLLQAELPLRPSRRGPHRWLAFWVRWQSPLGLMERTIREARDQTIRVLPDLAAVERAALSYLLRNDPFSGHSRQRFIGEGSEFDGLVEFQPGHDSRSLDWKATARHRKLLVREHRAETNHHVVIALDTGRLMCEPIDGLTRLDHAIHATLMLSWAALKAQDRVAVCGFDERLVMHHESRGGVHAIGGIRERLAALEYSFAETNFTLSLAQISQRLRRRSLLVVLTEFNDAIVAGLMRDALERLSRRHLVLFVSLRSPELKELALSRPGDLADVNRAVVAAGLVAERRAVLSQLKRDGVHVLDVDAADLSSALVNRYLDILRRELV
ncbi:MAG: DUF58 domain-containing protein [Planctomycetes bacterium]|nr:DUF58 domain-containing protein [Planctomycetota bacterium]